MKKKIVKSKDEQWIKPNETKIIKIIQLITNAWDEF